MSKKEGAEVFLVEGRKLEEKYDWISAVELYENALTATLNQNDFFKVARIYERIGYCYHRTAMQANDQQEFRTRMHQVINAYGKAAEYLEKAENPEKLAKKSHCKAMAAYASSWLEPNHASRKKALEECWKLEMEALKLYKGLHDQLNSAKTYNELNTCLLDRLDLEWDKQIREKALRTALSDGEKAITILSEMEEERELARAYCLSSILYHTAALGLELEKKSECVRKALSYSKKALEFSEKIGDHFLLGMSSIWLGSAIADFTDEQESAKKYFENGLQCGVRTNDNYLIGRASYLMAHLMCWNMLIEEDPEKKREESKVCREYCEDAIHHFSSISRNNEIASSYYWYAENYSVLAMSAETSSEKKRTFLKKSIEAGRKGLEFARRSGSISATWFVLHPLSKSLFYLSTLEIDMDMRKRLLEESLQYRKENIKALTLAMPYYFWNHGVYHNYLALIQAELAGLERNKEQKVKFYEEAIKSAEKCVTLCLKSGTLSHEQYAALGRYYLDLGGILNHFYLITGTHELLGKLSEAFKGALKTYEKAVLPNRVAESYWQLANTYNKMLNYTESADNFELAYENYILAAKKVPSLKDFYLNYASYMKGWSEIEKARYFHGRQEYNQAEEHYEKAAEWHESSKLWKYLAPNYLAWAQLERGENLSRNEQSREAITAFQQASKLFLESKASLDTTTPKIETDEEKEQALVLSRASKTREEYCQGRILLEEAKIYDRQSSVWQSAENYGLAAKVFRKVAEALEESERNELYSMIYFCQAWEKMKLAEQKVAPALFMESSKLFMKAKDYTTKEKTSLLAMGNSALCKALGAGTQFEATRELKLYSIAKRNLESAANYYVKAGFEKASIWVNANQALLDAYVYMSKAETETITEKKIPNYQLAEKYLERSAELFKKAEYVSKRAEVLRVLATVKDKHEFVLSLSGVLKPPALVSSVNVFSVPTSSREEAVGIEKFEHANIQAHLTVPSEVTANETFEVRLDMANVAKEPGLLVRIESLIPSNFKMTETLPKYKLEDGSIEVNGKRLEPQTVESIKIRVMASESGIIHLKPRIVYTDELGKFKICQPDPVTVAVYSPGQFQFKTNNAQRAFEFLTKAFAEDYMKRRLPIEKSGWRTLMQVVKNAKVSKSSIYGTGARRGKVISELEGRGIIEIRIFPEERGRGGQIMKARITYEKDIIKRYIDQQIMKIKEK